MLRFETRQNDKSRIIVYDGDDCVGEVRDVGLTPTIQFKGHLAIFTADGLRQIAGRLDELNRQGEVK